MRSYELVCAFRVKEGQDVAGIEAVKKILSEKNAEISSEEDMGDRDFAYKIEKETRARYRLFNIRLNPESLESVEDALKLRQEILRFLFVVTGNG